MHGSHQGMSLPPAPTMCREELPAVVQLVESDRGVLSDSMEVHGGCTQGGRGAHDTGGTRGRVHNGGGGEIYQA